VVAFAFSSCWTRAVYDRKFLIDLHTFRLMHQLPVDITVLFCLHQPVSDLQQSSSKLITKYDNMQFIITVKVIIADTHLLWTLCTCFWLLCILLFHALE